MPWPLQNTAGVFLLRLLVLHQGCKGVKETQPKWPGCAATVTKPSGSLALSLWLGFQPVTLHFPPRGGCPVCRGGTGSGGASPRPLLQRVQPSSPVSCVTHVPPGRLSGHCRREAKRSSAPAACRGHAGIPGARAGPAAAAAHAESPRPAGKRLLCAPPLVTRVWPNPGLQQISVCVRSLLTPPGILVAQSLPAPASCSLQELLLLGHGVATLWADTAPPARAPLG